MKEMLLPAALACVQDDNQEAVLEISTFPDVIIQELSDVVYHGR